MTIPRTPERLRSLISWDASGDYDGDYDDVTDDAQSTPGVKIERGRDKARALGLPMASVLTETLRNVHRRYSAQNSGSPLYGQVKSGRPTYFATDVEGSATMADPVVLMADASCTMSGGTVSRRLFTGTTEVPREKYGPGPNRRFVEINAIGGYARLSGVEVTLGVQANKTTGELLVLVWEAAGLVDGVTYVIDQDMIDNGRTVPWFWADKADAAELTLVLLATEGPPAAVYEDAFGRAVAEGHNYRAITARSQTVQYELFASEDDGELTFVGLEYEPGEEAIVNDVAFAFEVREPSFSQDLWYYDDTITLGAGGVLTLVATSDNPIVSFTTPTAGTDFILAAGTLASVTAVADGPFRVVITFTAGGGGATLDPATSDGSRLRGVPLIVIETPTAEPSIDASDSQAEFGVRALPSNARPWPVLTQTVANAIADAYLLAYADERPVVWLTIVNSSGANLDFISRVEVSDLIHAYDPTESGTDLDLTVETLEHEILGKWLHRLRLGCEQRIEQDWARYDVDDYDEGLYGN